ncbi:hypothetical protein [Alteromonas sp. W364]|uniref:hypothetical protein n=1 Tax=Alteromonas sp. W364 TaxID=3075610 RepID=UPI002887308D|nr:hypothetical protein [Alteromonas sp. W364]MDT0627621.1 hypothetical protein [Alteromonas sp. W364]
MSINQNDAESTDSQNSESAIKPQNPDVNASKSSRYEQENSSLRVPAQNVINESVNANLNKLEKDITKLKKALIERKAMHAELLNKHETLNRSLEDLGEISPRVFADYVSEPFDLLLAKFNQTEYEAFKGFFRSEEKNSQTYNYEALIGNFFATQETEHSIELHKVDCRLKQCKLFLSESERNAIFKSVDLLQRQGWASDFIVNGFMSYTYDNNGVLNSAFILSYLLPASSGIETNE